MKAFRFRLQRVLELRESEVKTEETELERLLAQRVRMEAERQAQLDSFLRETVLVRAKQILHPSELVMLDRYKQRVDREQQEWIAKLTTHDAAIDKQKARVIAARGRVKLMEKLREKRLAEWQADSGRELDELASDFSAAQWLRAR
jgi:flagellar export protein FliJ